MQVNFLTHFLSILLCRWKLPVATGSVFMFGCVWAETKLYYPSIGFATKGKQEAEAPISPGAGEPALMERKQSSQANRYSKKKTTTTTKSNRQYLAEQVSMQQGRPARTSNQVKQTDTKRRRRRACMQQGRPARTYQEKWGEASVLWCTQLLRTFSEPQEL
jgi:hypothetical protein